MTFPLKISDLTIWPTAQPQGQLGRQTSLREEQIGDIASPARAAGLGVVEALDVGRVIAADVYVVYGGNLVDQCEQQRPKCHGAEQPHDRHN